MTLGETFFIRGGRFEEDPRHGNRHFSTQGWGVRTLAFTKIIPARNIAEFLLHHVDIQYNHSEVTTDEPNSPLSGTNYDSVQIVIVN